MHTHQIVAAIALASLLAASGHAAGHRGLPWPGASSATDQILPPSDEGLQVRVEYQVEPLNAEDLRRERLEISAFFTGVDPIDPNSVVEVEQIEMTFQPVNHAYKQQSEKGEVRKTITARWKPRKHGVGFQFEATDPPAVRDAVKIQVFEFGQVVAELTDHVAAVEGLLTYRADLKLWELRVELWSVATASNVPATFERIPGSTSASLRIHQTHIDTKIRDNEFSFRSAQLVLQAETKVEDAGPESLREVFAVHATFASSELQPDPQFRALEDLAVDFGINMAGADAPFHLRIGIPGHLWSDGDGGGFAIEDVHPQSAGIQVLVVQNGQVVFDRTDHVAAFAARLRPEPGTTSWELKLEIAGIIIPTDVHAPLFARAWGAHLAMVEIGSGLEQRLARPAASEAIF